MFLNSTSYRPDGCELEYMSTKVSSPWWGSVCSCTENFVANMCLQLEVMRHKQNRKVHNEAEGKRTKGKLDIKQTTTHFPFLISVLSLSVQPLKNIWLTVIHRTTTNISPSTQRYLLTWAPQQPRGPNLKNIWAATLNYQLKWMFSCIWFA